MISYSYKVCLCVIVLSFVILGSRLFFILVVFGHGWITPLNLLNLIDKYAYVGIYLEPRVRIDCKNIHFCNFHLILSFFFLSFFGVCVCQSHTGYNRMNMIKSKYTQMLNLIGAIFLVNDFDLLRLFINRIVLLNKWSNFPNLKIKYQTV